MRARPGLTAVLAVLALVLLASLAQAGPFADLPGSQNEYECEDQHGDSSTEEYDPETETYTFHAESGWGFVCTERDGFDVETDDASASVGESRVDRDDEHMTWDQVSGPDSYHSNTSWTATQEQTTSDVDAAAKAGEFEARAAQTCGSRSQRETTTNARWTVDSYSESRTERNEAREGCATDARAADAVSVSRFEGCTITGERDDAREGGSWTHASRNASGCGASTTANVGEAGVEATDGWWCGDADAASSAEPGSDWTRECRDGRGARAGEVGVFLGSAESSAGECGPTTCERTPGAPRHGLFLANGDDETFVELPAGEERTHEGGCGEWYSETSVQGGTAEDPTWSNRSSAVAGCNARRTSTITAGPVVVTEDSGELDGASYSASSESNSTGGHGWADMTWGPTSWESTSVRSGDAELRRERRCSESEVREEWSQDASGSSSTSRLQEGATCRDAVATDGLTITRSEGCAYVRDSTYNEPSGADPTWSQHDWQGCGQWVVVDGPAGSASGGNGQVCETRWHNDAFESADCYDGLYVLAPDGMLVVVGSYQGVKGAHLAHSPADTSVPAPEV